jgi:hypothetical protein
LRRTAGESGSKAPQAKEQPSNLRYPLKTRKLVLVRLTRLAYFSNIE